jgi:hypothetical protein
MKENEEEKWWVFQDDGKRKATILNRFVDRIRSTFNKFQNLEEKKTSQLQGRIQDLQATADTILRQLSQIKLDLKKEIDEESFVYVEDVINPIIKEVSRLDSINKDASVTHQAKAFQRYNQWIEKAKLWVQIYSKADDRQAILQGIIQYIIDDFLEVIDRDRQVINDYQEHMLEALAVDEAEKIELAILLESRLQPYLKGLTDLRVTPRDMPLKEIAVWKAQVDKRREKYFDAALHAVDKIINQSIPDSTGEEEHDHLVDVLTQIVYLEQQAPDLIDEFYLAGKLTEDQKMAILNRMSLLEYEAHQLNLDLRLTPDLIDRLQGVLDMLSQLKRKMNK